MSHLMYDFSLLADDLVEEAAFASGEKKRKQFIFGWKQKSILFVTCCILVILFTHILKNDNEIVSEPGLLKITSSTFGTGLMPIEIPDVIQLPISTDNKWSLQTNLVPGLPLHFSYPKRDVSYSISVKEGQFICVEGKCHAFYHVGNQIDFYNGKTLSVGEESIKCCDCDVYMESNTLYWTCINDLRQGLEQIRDKDKSWDLIQEGTNAYIKIMIYEEEHIIGYAVMALYSVEPKEEYWYTPVLLESISFPKKNGTFQKIKEEYVQSMMDSIINDSQINLSKESNEG